VKADTGVLVSEGRDPRTEAAPRPVGEFRPPGAEGRPPALLVMGGYYGTLAAVRALGRDGIPVHVADPMRMAPARWSRYATRSSTCPWPDAEPERFLEWLLSVGEREPGQVLLATNDDTAWLLARHRDALARHYRLNVPSFEATDSLLNKWRLTRACAEVGVPTPKTWLAASSAELAPLQDEMRFPVLVKPQSQVLQLLHSKGVLVERPEALAESYTAVRESAGFAGPIVAQNPGVICPLVQEFARSTAGIYGLSGFVDASGELFVAVASRKVLQRPRTAGVGLCFETDGVRPELAASVARLCRHVGYHGVFEVEFLDAEGSFQLIDFNPRFFGQMSLDIDRGLDLPRLAYLHAVGDTAGTAALVAEARRRLASEPGRRWCNSIQMMSYLTLRRLRRGGDRGEWRRWRRWCRAHGAQMTDAVLTRDDYGPAALEIAVMASGMLRHPRAWLRQAWN
jgi:D-aspartate ligase